MAMITRPKSTKNDPDQTNDDPDQNGGVRRKSSTSSSLRSAFEKVKDSDVADILDDALSDGFIDDDTERTSPPIKSSSAAEKSSSSSDEQSSSSSTE